MHPTSSNNWEEISGHYIKEFCNFMAEFDTLGLEFLKKIQSYSRLLH